jgi:hypothetical protein
MITTLFEMGLSLSMTSNQGFERSHLFHHSVFSRIINYGGGKLNYSMAATEQLLIWQWRKVLLAIDLKERSGSTYWDEKRLKKAYSHKKTKSDLNKYAEIIENIEQDLAKKEQEEKDRVEEEKQKKLQEMNRVETTKKRKKSTTSNIPTYNIILNPNRCLTGSMSEPPNRKKSKKK